MMLHIVLYALGFISGIMTLIVISCCVASADFARRLEDWSNKDD